MTKTERFRAVIVDGKPRIKARRQWNRYLSHFGEGEEVTVTIGPVERRRTLAQNAGFHAMVEPWSKSEGYPIEALKRDLLGEVFGYDEVESPVTGQVERVLREPHTSKLTVEQFSELIERTLVIAAECGVRLVAPNEYPERR